MSELTALSRLANLADAEYRSAQLAGIHTDGATARKTQPVRRKGVSDLLGTVMALSARTRRMAQAGVEIDLDVFTPEGHRAVRLILDNED